MVRGLLNPLGIVSSRIVKKTIPNMLVNTAGRQKLGISKGHLAEVATVACCPNQNGPNTVSVLRFNLTSKFNNMVSMWFILNALGCNILNNMA